MLPAPPDNISCCTALLRRAVLFPFTMLFGPFVNDAVAALGQVGSGKALRLSETCRSLSQEFEADAVSARILAHAGRDARATIAFWEQRREADVSECTPRRAAQNAGIIPLDEGEDTATRAAIRAATNRMLSNVRDACSRRAWGAALFRSTQTRWPFITVLNAL